MKQIFDTHTHTASDCTDLTSELLRLTAGTASSLLKGCSELCGKKTSRQTIPCLILHGGSRTTDVRVFDLRHAEWVDTGHLDQGCAALHRRRCHTLTRAGDRLWAVGGCDAHGVCDAAIEFALRVGRERQRCAW